jgi:hypothetical protein
MDGRISDKVMWVSKLHKLTMGYVSLAHPTTL